MRKIAEFLSKWAIAIFLILLGVVLLFAIACCIYTAIANPFVGIVGCVGVAISLAVVVCLIWTEIKEVKIWETWQQ